MILDGTIVTADIAVSGVTSSNILDGTIVAADLATGAVTSTAILDGTILTADFADSSVTLAKLANMATASVIYRKTAGTGAPEVNTLATLKTDLGLQSPPVGMVFDYAGTSCPSLSLAASGQDVSRSTYSALFTAISTTYGAGNGTTTYTMPDATGRVVAGKEATATRLTSAGSGVDGGTLGATGGAQNESVLLANLPAANLSASGLSVGTSLSSTVVTAVGQSKNSNLSPSGATSYVTNVTPTTTAVALASGAVSGTVPTGGSGTALTTVQPTIVLLKCIYAGA